VDINVGDTRGPAGVFRALRTIPVMLDICKDIHELCPRAIFLNYTNPMAMLCRAMQQTHPDLAITGLCHSVQGTARMLARWIGAPVEEIDYLCAGINHQAWYLTYEWNRKDAYPLIRKAVRRKKIRNAEQVRNEMFRHLGYYVTESSGHNSEYNWWFRKRPDLIERYCTHGTGWNPGEYAYILKNYKGRVRSWKRQIREWIENKEPLNLSRGHEYAASIIDAYMGGPAFLFNGNVPNAGLIDNLPRDCCVEVPVFADHRGLNPVHVGALPPQLAALNHASVAVEEMAVEAALTGNPERVFHAIAYDPLTAAVLSLEEIRRMVNALFRKSRDYLPQFKDPRI
jgi:alpha-galactosidase